MRLYQTPQAGTNTGLEARWCRLIRLRLFDDADGDNNEANVALLSPSLWHHVATAPPHPLLLLFDDEGEETPPPIFLYVLFFFLC